MAAPDRDKALDSALFTLTYPGGRVGQVQISWGLPSGVQYLERHSYVGPDGLLVVNWNSGMSLYRSSEGEAPRDEGACCDEARRDGEARCGEGAQRSEGRGGTAPVSARDAALAKPEERSPPPPPGVTRPSTHPGTGPRDRGSVSTSASSPSA